MEFILIPPVAFLIYLVLTAVLTGMGRVLAGKGRESALKSTAYASGEAAPMSAASPGYGTFFLVALFFAVLHLGVLMLASSGLVPVSGIYLIGLALALVALILG
ncbi:MAG: hypothetical protein IT324_18795 [Anaerolineae bacterium]|nr:hypothetical protein [Anaerolineae bacterium]